MGTPLSLPYRADMQRYYHQLQQVGSPDALRLRALLHQAHDTVARWCLLPDVPPDAAQQLRRSERELQRLKDVALALPAGTGAWTSLRQQLSTLLGRVCAG